MQLSDFQRDWQVGEAEIRRMDWRRQYRDLVVTIHGARDKRLPRIRGTAWGSGVRSTASSLLSHAHALASIGAWSLSTRISRNGAAALGLSWLLRRTKCAGPTGGTCTQKGSSPTA